MNREEVLSFVLDELNTVPDYPFQKSPQHAVLRHKRTGKWFGIILTVDASKLGLDKEEKVDVLNVKCDPELIPMLRSQRGIFSAYDMNKDHWISILLDEACEKKQVKNLLLDSFHLTR